MGDGHYWGMHWIWWIFWLMIVLFFFALLFYIPRQQLKRGDSPMDILKRRYAAGEIDTEEYLLRKKELEKDR